MALATAPSGDTLISNLPTASNLNSTEYFVMDQTVNTVNGPTTTTVKISSPTLAEQILTLVGPVGIPSLDVGTLTLTNPLAVTSGGTGLATLTAHSVLLGEGTGNVSFATPSTANFALLSNGASADPSFQQLTAPIINFTASGTGAVVRTQQSKNSDIVSVKDFGAVGNGSTDDSTAFQAAVNALPTAGGTILVPSAHYVVNTAPTWGTKTVFWDIDPAAVISGTQTTFPTAVTNAGVIPVGPWMVNQSPVVATANNGTASFSVEAIQPASLNGGVSGYYGGVQLNSNGANSIGLAANFVATANAGSSGNVWGLEIDVASFAGVGVGTQFGLSINGAGTDTITFAIKTQMASSANYLYGIDLQATVIGLFVENTTGHQNSIIAGTIASRYSGNTVQLGQLSNSSGNSALLIQRYTDTSPVGYFINAINYANSASLFSVDVSGNLFASTMSSTHLTVTGNASAVASGSFQLGAASSSTATAGVATLPANPLGFLIAYLGSTEVKIPYYNV